MLSQPEHRGGLIGQLRDHALRGSDDGLWNQPISQVFNVSRSVSIGGEVDDVIRVELVAARRIDRALGVKALRTFYSLKATHTQANLSLEFLPENVVDILRRKKVAAGEDESDWEVLAVHPEDEYDEHEFDGYDEMRFRHVRSLEYTLNGRGTLLHSTRTDLYEDDDDESAVEIAGVRIWQPGTHAQEEAGSLHSEIQGIYPHESASPDYELYPNLQHLEPAKGVLELEGELSFFELVEQYRSDTRLARYTHAEHRRAMLTLLAFLRMEASTSAVREIL
ncbi:MAG: hypothetical protein WAQ27_03305 [Candidatus Microsaccharimonas sp.]